MERTPPKYTKMLPRLTPERKLKTLNFKVYKRRLHWICHKLVGVSGSPGRAFGSCSTGLKSPWKEMLRTGLDLTIRMMIDHNGWWWLIIMNHDNDDSEYGHHNTDITHDDSDSSHCLVATSLWLVFQRKELKSHYRWLVMASVTSHQSGIRDRSHPRAILIEPITTPCLSMMGCQPSGWPCKCGMLSQWSRDEQAIDFYKDSYGFKAAKNIQKIDLRCEI